MGRYFFGTYELFADVFFAASVRSTGPVMTTLLPRLFYGGAMNPGFARASRKSAATVERTMWAESKDGYATAYWAWWIDP